MDTIFQTENQNQNQNNFGKEPQFQLPSSIKDTRCSSRCTQNWTKFGQTPPLGHFCTCSFNK